MSGPSLEERIAAHLPEPLLEAKRWLLWKVRPHPDPVKAKAGKTKKVPFYANGNLRTGTLDAEPDLAQLVTFEEAVNAYLVDDYTGLGFAVVKGDGIGGFDLDKCLDADRLLEEDHAGYDLACRAMADGAYIELSPSGRGLRIIGPCAVTEAYSKDDLEYWGAGRFVTITGDLWANARGWEAIGHLRTPLGARRTRGDEQGKDEGGIITPRTIDELRDALSAFPSDERELWVRMGHALKTIGDKGKALWLEWSARSDKFDKADALAKWDSFEPTSTSHKAVFAEAQRHGWKNPRKRDHRPDPAPADLWAGYTAPELPDGLLPPVIEEFARKQGAVMGVDPAGLAMSALAVAAAAITDEITLQVKQHDKNWRESARLWIGLVGAPSTKKSPILREATRPLHKIDGAMARTYAARMVAYDRLEAAERRATERPKQERRIISDATIEAAQEVLKDSPWGLLSVQDELSGWFGSMDKYSPGKGAQADRGFWLQSFNGGSYSANRIGRGAVHIENCSVSLLGGIQPEPLRKIANETVDDGLIQRLIPVILRAGQTGQDAPSNMVVADYADLIDDLVEKPGQLLRFDDGARVIREALEVRHLEAVHALEAVSPKLAAHFGKYDGLFARLCVLWHVIEHAAGEVPDLIEASTAKRVADFMDQFIKRSAVAFYAGQLRLSGDYDEVLALASFILAENLEEVDARTVQRSGWGRTFTADQVRELCERLAAFGWLDPIEPKGIGKPTRWQVNPHVHIAFEEHGRRERERRAAAREALEHAFKA